MHRHQLHCLHAARRLVVACFQRGVREKGGERVRHFLGALAVVFVQKSRGGVDQLLQVFDAVGLGLGSLIMRDQPACVQQMFNLFGQIEARGFTAHGFD